MKHPIVILGTAKHINEFDLSLLDGIETIACNAILLHPTFRPKHLVIADRRAYIPEFQSGRLAKVAKSLDLILSSAIWDPKVVCGGSPLQKRPKFKHRVFRQHGSKSPINITTLKKPVNSCANSGIMLFQLAAILGASDIGVLGMGFVPAPKDQKGHFFKGKGGNKSRGQQTPERSVDCAQKIKKALKKAGIRVYNFCPKHPRFAKIFGRYDYEKFVREAKK